MQTRATRISLVAHASAPLYPVAVNRPSRSRWRRFKNHGVFGRDPSAGYRRHGTSLLSYHGQAGYSVRNELAALPIAPLATPAFPHPRQNVAESSTRSVKISSRPSSIASDRSHFAVSLMPA